MTNTLAYIVRHVDWNPLFRSLLFQCCSIAIVVTSYDIDATAFNKITPRITTLSTTAMNIITQNTVAIKIKIEILNTA